MKKCILLIGVLAVILFIASNANAGYKVWRNLVPPNIDTVIYTVPAGATVDIGIINITSGSHGGRVTLYRDTTIIATFAVAAGNTFFQNFSYLRYNAGQQIRVRYDPSGISDPNFDITITGNQTP